MIPFIGDLTKIVPPTWKADNEDPYRNAYEDNNSVGYWARVGNLVWFSVTFVFDSSGISSASNGDGAYYWAPSIDGAPPIDSDIYDNIEGQSIVCGAASIHRFNRNTYSITSGSSVIDVASSRIYVQLGGRRARVSDTLPFTFDENEGFRITGTYATKI